MLEPFDFKLNHLSFVMLYVSGDETGGFVASFIMLWTPTA